MKEGVCNLELLGSAQNGGTQWSSRIPSISTSRSFWSTIRRCPWTAESLIITSLGFQVESTTSVATSNVGETNPCLDFGSCLVKGLVNRTDDLHMSKNGFFVPMRLACLRCKFAACVFIIPIDSHDETLPALPCDVNIGGSQLAPVGHRAQLLSEAEGGLWTGRQRVARRKPRSMSCNGKTYGTLIVMDREDAVGNQWWYSISMRFTLRFSRISKYISTFQWSCTLVRQSDTVGSHSLGPRISPLPCHQLEPSDRGLVEASVHLLHFATNSHPTTWCMINKWCCMIKQHVTNPPTHKSSTEVVVDGPLRQPMVWDLDDTFSSLFWKVHLIASQPWNCQNNLHDLPAWRWLNHQADYIACSEKNAEYDVQGSLGSLWWYSYPLISYVLAQSTHAALQAHFIWNIQAVQYPKKFSAFSLVTESWKITALNTFNSDIFFWYLWCSTKKCVKVHCSCPQPVRVTRNDVTQEFNRLNRWTSIFHNFSRFPFCKSLNHFNMLLNSVREQWLK